MSASRMQVARIDVLLRRMGAGRETLAEVDPAWEDYENQDSQTADEIIAWLRGDHTKIAVAVERVRTADATATSAREELRILMRAEIAAGRTTKSEIARTLGVSRQRVQQMLK